MGKWTRRDLVKAGLAASAGVMTGSDLLAQASEPSKAAAAPTRAGALAADANAPNTLRERLLLDYGWRFALGNANDPDKDFGFGKLRGSGTFAKAGQADGPASLRFNDSAWSKIDLPHDWAIDLPFVNNPVLVGHGAKPLGREYPRPALAGTAASFSCRRAMRGAASMLSLTGSFATPWCSLTATTSPRT